MNIHAQVAGITQQNGRTDEQQQWLLVLKSPILLNKAIAQLHKELPAEEATSLEHKLRDIADELQSSQQTALKEAQAQTLAFKAEHNPTQLKAEIKADLERFEQISQTLNTFNQKFLA